MSVRATDVSRQLNDGIAGTMEGLKISEVEGEENLGTCPPCRDEMEIIIDGTTAYASCFRFVIRMQQVYFVEGNNVELGGNLFAQK